VAPVIDARARAELMKLIRLGMELEHCCARLDLDEEVVRGDAELMAAIARAYRCASARLRAQLVEMALKRGDSRALAVALEAREREALALAACVGAGESRDAGSMSAGEAIGEWRRMCAREDSDKLRERIARRLVEKREEDRVGVLEELRAELQAEIERHGQARHAEAAAGGAVPPVRPERRVRRDTMPIMDPVMSMPNELSSEVPK
jgi:hypothetical protein